MNLEPKVAAASAQMRARLDETRATFEHGGNKGDHVEAAFRDFLRQYLPRRLEIGHGEVVDSHGARSGQTDVVIANEDHPFTFDRKAPGLFFVEGVSAAGEVKSVLTREHFNKALDSARAFKRLRAEMPEGTMVHAGDSDLQRYYVSPPYFLIAMESQLSQKTIYDELVAAGPFRPDRSDNGVDAVFVLDKGSIIDFGDGKGALCFRTSEGKILPGWQSKTSTNVLFDLLGWLYATMPTALHFRPALLRYLVKGA